MLSKRCVSTTHHGVLIYTPQKHTLSCVILRTKGVFGEHTMVCSGNTLVFTVQSSFNLSVCLIAGGLSRSAGSGLVTSYSGGRLTFLCV